MDCTKIVPAPDAARRLKGSCPLQKSSSLLVDLMSEEGQQMSPSQSQDRGMESSEIISIDEVVASTVHCPLESTQRK